MTSKLNGPFGARDNERVHTAARAMTRDRVSRCSIPNCLPSGIVPPWDHFTAQNVPSGTLWAVETSPA